MRLAFRDLRGSRAMRSLWVFCASLVLGIMLVSACGSLLQLVSQGFEHQQRHLFGGDLQISQRSPLQSAQLDWVTANAEISRLMKLRTMLGSEAGDYAVVELHSVDNAYPLYGSVLLAPDQTLESAVGQSDNGVWGVAFDPVLAEQLSLVIGQQVSIGSLQFELRAMIMQQPDRRLTADVRGPPVIIHDTALKASGLVQPGSLVDYEYRVRTLQEPSAWRSRLRNEFPDAAWEVETVDERGDVVSERLDQVASVLLLIGFSTLFIGGMGVSNSISAYLQTKLTTLATLQSLGCRSAHVALVYVGQVTMLGLIACTIGALIGSAIAWLAALALSSYLPIDVRLSNMWKPTLLSIVFGAFTALLFALPMIGRTLALPTAQLIRGLPTLTGSTPTVYRIATGIVLVLLVLLLLVLIPRPVVALGFVLTLIVMLLVLELIVRLIRVASRQLARHRWLDGRVALRLASASLARTGSSLRPMLLSLGTALTLLVAAFLVIAATIKTLNSTVPARAPSLVFYDLQLDQIDAFTKLTRSLDGYEDAVIAPLVLGRLTSVNGEQLSNSGVAQRALEANDEHKLSYRTAGVDNTSVDRGAWWPTDYTGDPLVAMEDREADQLGLQVGDALVFTILGEPVGATLSAIYKQARFETSFWLEAVFSQGVLDPFISRNIGSLRFANGADISAQRAIAAEFPNVVILRTAKILSAARSILASVSLGVLAITVISLAASILVMASVVAVSRQQQVYEASVMHALGTRMKLIMRSVIYEYALLAVILTFFATMVGSAIAWLIFEFWLKLPGDRVWLFGWLVAALASSICLMAGALWLQKSLSVTPAVLLKRSAA